MKTIIIGAGLTGLSLAHQLKKQKKDFIVFEKNSEVGGTARSFKINDEWFDYGIHVVNTLHPLIKVPMKKYERVAKINMFNEILDYPYQMNKGKIDNSLYSIPANYYDYLLLKYGEDAFKFHIPYAEQFWNYDLKQMDWKWTVKYTPQGKGINNIFYYPKKGGIGTIANELCKKVEKNIFLNTRVEYIDIDNKKIFTNNGVIEYDKIYNTCPIPELSCMIKIEKVKQAIDRLKYTSMQFRHEYNKNNLYIIIEDKAVTHWDYYINKTYIRSSFSFNSNNKNIKQQEIIIHDILNYNVDKINDYRYLKYAYCIPTLTLEEDMRIINTYMEHYDIYNRGRFGRWKNMFMHESLNETL